MNGPLRRVAVAALVLFALLIGNANYVQVLQGNKLRTDSGNTRLLLEEYERQRGAIVVDGKSVAESRPTNDKLKYLRSYPGEDVYAPATGFYSVVYGATGIEQGENDILTGNDDRLFTGRLSDLLTGRDPRGGNVVLTLSRAAQETAYRQLGGRRGAVVALDPRTGAILAMATSPSYDPTTLSSHNPISIRSTYDKLTADENDPMLDRAINQRYPPGSTFKVIVSAAALSAGLKPDTQIDCPQTYTPPQTSRALPNFNGETCGAAKVPLIEAFTQSFNTAFAKLAVEQLKEPAVREQAAAFGLTSSGFSMPLDVSASQVCDRHVDPPSGDGKTCQIPDEPALAQSAIGQRNVAITPLQGAMMAAAVANRGLLMKPYLVKELQATDLNVLDRTDPAPFDPDRPQAISPEVAAQLSTMMVSVVQNGTGRSAQLPGVQVAGKTGTAQNGRGADHAWFVGFAPADNPTVAVAVVLENAGGRSSEVTGGKAAAPIAASVIKAALAAQRGGG